jgi:hypothetical protein
VRSIIAKSAIALEPAFISCSEIHRKLFLDLPLRVGSLENKVPTSREWVKVQILCSGMHRGRQIILDNSTKAYACAWASFQYAEVINVDLSALTRLDSYAMHNDDILLPIFHQLLDNINIITVYSIPVDILSRRPPCESAYHFLPMSVPTLPRPISRVLTF